MSSVQKREIVVDLDGTLVNTDMLIENLFLFLRHHPFRFFEVIVWLFSGKANFKRQLANVVMPDVSLLPYNEGLLDWLKKRRSEGARLTLATASHLSIATQIAQFLGIFDEVIATQDINMSSANKRDALVRRYGAHSYEYVGNSADDVAVWEKSSAIHMVNPEAGVSAAASRIGKVGFYLKNRPPYLSTLVKGLRVHQWAKNLLIFVPLITAHKFLDVTLLLNGVIAFLAFGVCASSVYVLNDLLDLQDDRLHRTKRHRPLASGALPILHTLLLIPSLLLGAFGLAIWLLPFKFVIVLAIYYLLTLAYSLWLKRIVMLDVVTLAILYTMRIIAGAAVTYLAPTFWILAFSVFIFLSLAFVKRYTELRDARQNKSKDKAAGRGYYPQDFELLASLGGASGYISVLVLALYINEIERGGRLYQSPEWMWAACPLLLFWLSRVWLLAHRGQMHDDPIVFALRDKTSRWIGVAFITVFALAAI